MIQTLHDSCEVHANNTPLPSTSPPPILRLPSSPAPPHLSPSHLPLPSLLPCFLPPLPPTPPLSPTPPTPPSLSCMIHGAATCRQKFHFVTGHPPPPGRGADREGEFRLRLEHALLSLRTIAREAKAELKRCVDNVDSEPVDLKKFQERVKVAVHKDTKTLVEKMRNELDPAATRALSEHVALTQYPESRLFVRVHTKEVDVRSVPVGAEAKRTLSIWPSDKNENTADGGRTKRDVGILSSAALSERTKSGPNSHRKVLTTGKQDPIKGSFGLGQMQKPSQESFLETSSSSERLATLVEEVDETESTTTFPQPVSTTMSRAITVGSPLTRRSADVDVPDAERGVVTPRRRSASGMTSTLSPWSSTSPVRGRPRSTYDR